MYTDIYQNILNRFVTPCLECIRVVFKRKGKETNGPYGRALSFRKQFEQFEGKHKFI